jgi:hypothetical protein
MPRFQPSEEAPLPPTSREVFLRYSALMLAVVLILASLTLRAAPKSHALLTEAVHGSISGFLPFPVTDSWTKDETPDTTEHAPATVAPPALITPALMPASGPETSLTPEGTPADSPEDSSDSALSIPYSIHGPARTGAPAAQTPGAISQRLMSIHTPPATRFDGD